MSAPFQAVQDPNVVSVFLTHPGASTAVLQATGDGRPHAVVAMMWRMPDFMSWACRDVRQNRGVYLYDTTEPGTRAFLGAVTVHKTGSARPLLTSLDRVPYPNIPVPRRSLRFETSMQVVDRQWTVVIVPLDDNEAPNLVFVMIGGAVIFAALCVLACMLMRCLGRVSHMNRLKSRVEMDKVEAHHHQVQRERRLNECMAYVCLFVCLCVLGNSILILATLKFF